MKRQIPHDLYDTVVALTSIIAHASMGEPDRAADERAQSAYSELRVLYTDREASGETDPFLTETVADFTDDPAEAVYLYELALEQSAGFPGEPVASKRVGLAQVLLSTQRIAEARDVIELGQRAAFAEGDADAVRELADLAQQLEKASTTP